MANEAMEAGFQNEHWERYDRVVDSMDEDEVREALKREARIRAHYQNRQMIDYVPGTNPLFKIPA